MSSPATANTASLIAIDWGTSRLRASLVDRGGRVLAEAESGDGIGAMPPGSHAAVFERVVGDWPLVPAIMSGMVGSRQGWREAAYVTCPATVDVIANSILRFTSPRGRPVAIVPGLVVRSPDRDADVIRGEETQIAGLLAGEPNFAGLVVLPGTHSKLVAVADGAVRDFQTCLTGELFRLLAESSILRYSVAGGRSGLSDSADFDLGVRRTALRGVPFLSAIFSVRARHLVDGVAPEDNLAYLSGLLIGAEIAAARTAGRLQPGDAVRVVGTRSLARAYRAAFDLVGHEAEPVDGGRMALAGLLTIARRVGLAGPAAPAR